MNRTKKIMRGGSWFDAQDYARAALRSSYHPDARYDLFGFRVKKQIKADTKRLRGGSWIDGRDYARAAYRYSIHPFNRSYFIGFRVKRRRRNE